MSELWVCPDCAFGFDASHEDEGGGYSCPLCALAAAEQQIATLREALRDVLARDSEESPSGVPDDCACINISRRAEREYETGRCPHQRARKLLALPAPQSALTPTTDHDPLDCNQCDRWHDTSIPAPQSAPTPPAREERPKGYAEWAASAAFEEGIPAAAESRPPEAPPYDFAADIRAKLAAKEKP